MEKAARLDEIIGQHAGKAGPLLPILHDVQAEFGCVDEASVRHVSAALNLTRAEVYGVVTFYHDFRAQPAPLPVVKLCRAEACQARGCDALAADIEDKARGKCQIESIYCLGLCSAGPNAMIGGDVYARLDSQQLSDLIEAL
jgi:formate dehydrogenase subunit gamma